MADTFRIWARMNPVNPFWQVAKDPTVNWKPANLQKIYDSFVEDNKSNPTVVAMVDSLTSLTSIPDTFNYQDLHYYGSSPLCTGDPLKGGTPLYRTIYLSTLSLVLSLFILRMFCCKISTHGGNEDDQPVEANIRLGLIAAIKLVFGCLGCVSWCGAYFVMRTPCRGSSESTETSKQPIRTRYLGHVTGNQPIRDQVVEIGAEEGNRKEGLPMGTGPGPIDEGIAKIPETLCRENKMISKPLRVAHRYPEGVKSEIVKKGGSPCWGNSASQLNDAGRTHSFFSIQKRRNDLALSGQCSDHSSRALRQCSVCLFSDLCLTKMI
eukprot:sb/3466828/